MKSSFIKGTSVITFIQNFLTYHILFVRKDQYDTVEHEGIPDNRLTERYKVFNKEIASL